MSSLTIGTSQKTFRLTDLDASMQEVLADALGEGCHQLPEIEADAEAMRFLNGFLKHIDVQRRLALAEVDHTSLLKEDYRREGTSLGRRDPEFDVSVSELRLQEQLKVIGVTRDALTREGQTNVALVARIAEKLQLRQPQLNHICCKWTQLCLRQHSANEKRVITLSLVDVTGL